MGVAGRWLRVGRLLALGQPDIVSTLRPSVCLSCGSGGGSGPYGKESMEAEFPRACFFTPGRPTGCAFKVTCYGVFYVG